MEKEFISLILQIIHGFFGGKDNRSNFNNIPPISFTPPEVSQTFTFIASSIFDDKIHFKRVYDHTYDQKKNEINFALAGANKGETIKDRNPAKDKFTGTEYVIWDYDQILPMLSVTARRMEYCVIWRDNNFSSKPVYDNKFDQMFKKFLNERLKYIRSQAKYNIYPC